MCLYCLVFTTYHFVELGSGGIFNVHIVEIHRTIVVSQGHFFHLDAFASFIVAQFVWSSKVSTMVLEQGVHSRPLNRAADVLGGLVL